MLGQNIRKLRTMRQISQKTLADELGFSYQNISKWENDVSMPDIPTVLALAQFFGVSTDVLLGNAPRDQELTLEVAINRLSDFSVWTDFPYQDSMGVPSYSFEGRRRTEAKFAQAASNHGEAMVFGVDAEGRICLILRRTPRGADWSFYDRPGTAEACIKPRPGYEKDWRKKGWYELVIPEGGFLIGAGARDMRVKQLLEFVVPKKYHDFIDPANPGYRGYHSCHDGRSLFHDVLSRGELDDVRVTLKGCAVVLTKPGAFVDPLAQNIDDLTQLVKQRFELSLRDMRNQLTQIETRLEESEELDCRIEDLACMIEDLTCRLDELESRSKNEE